MYSRRHDDCLIDRHCTETIPVVISIACGIGLPGMLGNVRLAVERHSNRRDIRIDFSCRRSQNMFDIPPG